MAARPKRAGIEPVDLTKDQIELLDEIRRRYPALGESPTREEVHAVLDAALRTKLDMPASDAFAVLQMFAHERIDQAAAAAGVSIVTNRVMARAKSRNWMRG